jgi:Flp pilus assembly protein TadD
MAGAMTNLRRKEMLKDVREIASVGVLLLVLAAGQGSASRAQEPTTAEQDVQRGRVLFLQGNYQGAVEVLRQAVTKKPDLAEAHYYLGMALYRLNIFDQAEPELREALKLRGNNYPDAHFGLGMLFFRKRENEAAVRELKTAIDQRNGSYPDASNVLGVIYFNQKNYGEAVVHFRHAVAGEPHRPEFNFNLGQAVEKELVEGTGSAPSGTWSEAIEAYRKAIESRGNYLLARRALGLALIGTDNEAAVAELQSVVQQIQPSPERMQLEEIIDLIKKPDDPDAHPEEISKVKGVGKIPPLHPTDEAVTQKVQGSVILSALFCYDKRVRVLKVVKGIGHGMDEAVVNTVRRIPYEPQQVGGRSVSERRLIKFDVTAARS